MSERLVTGLIVFFLSVGTSAVGGVMWFLGRRLIDQYDQRARERDQTLTTHEDTIREMKAELTDAQRQLEKTVNGGYEDLDERIAATHEKLDLLLTTLDAKEDIDNSSFDIEQTDPSRDS